MPYRVEKFSISKLRELLDELSHRKQGYSSAKGHLSYFDDYLRFINAKTIVVEHPYTDKDYLEDYAAYYARCHDVYAKRCARLHFFNKAFGEDRIQRVLAGNKRSIQSLQGSYLGFMVVKPLPSTVVGRTCLVTYGNIRRKRSFPVTIDYRAHLLGIELCVTSLAFQEQDTDVAACATSALWSAFHATGHLFQHHIPTPAEITNVATASQRPVNRALPASDGLSAPQMADAIRGVGLEPLHLGVKNLDILRISVCAYLRAKIPCILLGEVVEGNPSTRSIGNHAITVAGFSNPTGSPKALSNGGTLFTSVSTDRLYAHDDQVGPFARLQFSRKISDALQTSLLDDKKTIGNIFFKPRILLVPLYHKVRVPVTSIISTVSALDSYLEMARAANLMPLPERLEWDVYLTDNSTLKAEILGDTRIDRTAREAMLAADLPRYIWRAIAKSEKKIVFELVFDATDLLQGGHVVGGLPRSDAVCRSASALAKNPSVIPYIQTTGNRGLEMAMRWFADNF